MSQDIITAVVFEKDRIEWATLRNGEKRRAQAAGSIDCPGWAAMEDNELEPVIEQLKSRKKEFGRRIAVALSSERLLLRIMSLPSDEEDELQSMVQLQVDKLSPFAEADTVWSYEILASEDGASHVIVAMAGKKFLDRVDFILQSAGIKPNRLDCGSMGLIQALRDAGALDESGREVIIFPGPETSEILVFEDGRPVAVRTADMPGDSDPEEIGLELGRDIAYTLLSLEVEHGVAEGQRIRAWVPESLDPAVIAAAGRETDAEISRESLDKLSSVAEGVAVRESSRHRGLLDLTPLEWRQARLEKGFKKRVIGWTVGIIVFWLAFVGLGMGFLQIQRTELAELKATDEKLNRAFLDVRELRARALMFRHYTDKSHSALESLWEISRKLPDGVELRSFAYRKGEFLRITGEASQVDMIYEFKTRLDASDLFGESILKSVRRDRRKAKEIYDIEIRLPEEEL